MNDMAARALSLFDDYVDLPASEREHKLLQLAAHEPALHDTLRALLDADEADDEHLLDRSPADLLADKQRNAGASAQDERADARIGARLGPWRIDRVVARGGMGTVYEAHRDDGEYQQRVALKCIRTELATPQLLDAFRDERNLLARLDHPGIAALVDGGVGEDGQPWFAMRYIDGVTLDAWCDHRRASVRERVDLLIQACDALAHAHAQGVVHRDIKPSNLLVTSAGRVQLVDFGISSHFTAAGPAPREAIAITPDYAAPEACEHGSRGPATDQYALGVLMYRLLCAQWPAPLHSLRNLIPVAASGEPVPMERLLDDGDDGDAAAFIARQRGAANTAALRRQLAGDLSAIALKAVAPRPQDRYASVSEFGQDLRRWREHRPSTVRPGSWWSRLRKWRLRNPNAAMLAAATVLALSVGLGFSLWQSHRSAREAQAGASLSRLFASTLGTATLSGLGTTGFSSRTLLEKTERDLRAMPLADQPQLFARGLATLARSYAVIGDYRYAERLSRQAQDLLDRSGESDAFVVSARIAMLNIQYRFAQARDLAKQQIAALGDRDDEQTQLTRIAYGAELAKAQWGLGDNQQAGDTANLLVEQARALGPGHDEIVAQTLMLRGGLWNKSVRAPQAENDLRQAVALARPSNSVLADDAVEQLVRLLMRRGSSEQLPLAESLLRDRRDTLGESHPKTAQAMVLKALARYPDASREEVEQALKTMRARLGRGHPDYAMALSASAWAMTPDQRERIVLMREALATLQKTDGPRSERTNLAKYNLGKELTQLPRALFTRPSFDEGMDLLWQTARQHSKTGLPSLNERTELIVGLLRFGDDGQLPQAQALIDESRREAARFHGANDGKPQHVEHLADRLAYRQGRYAEADRAFARRIEANREFMRTPLTAKSTADILRGLLLSQALIYRALYAYQQCHQDQAEAFLQQAIDFDRNVMGKESLATRGALSYLDNLRKHARMTDDSDLRLVPQPYLDHLNQQARACRSPSAR